MTNPTPKAPVKISYPTDENGGGHDAALEYHARMIGDHHRVVAYDRALRKLVRPGDRVLDAGAGTGLLAMLAARAGAGHVWAVESMPVVNSMRALIKHNGLSDKVTPVNIDLRDFEGGPFDVIVSDCLGRFLIDDQMMEAMTAAYRLLAPGGHLIPGLVDLMLAPVAIGHLGALDTWVHPVLGLDFAPLAAAAENEAFGVQLGPDAVLGEPQVFATWHPPAPAPEFDRELTFEVSRAGRLRGFAGWFRAELAPTVILSTEPGVETHWHQLIFPLPPVAVTPGDRIAIHLYLGDHATTREPPWAWDVRITFASGAPERTFSRDAGDPLFHVNTVNIDERGLAPLSAEGAEVANERGADAFIARDFPTAIAAFEAAVRQLRPSDSQMLAGDIYENLGLARAAAGFNAAAIIPFMRAIDADPATPGATIPKREQSLRILVDCAFRSGRARDGERFLAAYEATFGPHPSNWGKAKT